MSRKDREDYELRYWRNNGLKRGAKYFTRVHERRVKLFDSLCKLPNNALTALEIGPGPFGGMALVYEVGTWFLLDPLYSEYANMVDVFSKDNCFLLENYCEEMPLDDESMDLVFSCNSLDHADNYIKCIKEIYRVLKKNGLFYLLVDCRTEHQLNPGHIHSFSPKEMVNFITKAGFDLVARKNVKREAKAYLNLAAAFRK